MVVWEDHGLFHEIDPFLRNLQEPEGDLAVRELAEILAELRIAGLGSQLERARNLRAPVVAAAEPFHNGTDGQKPRKAFILARKTFAASAHEAEAAKILGANGRTRTGTVLPTGT